MITEAGIKSALLAAPKINKTVELKDGGERGAGRLVLVVRPFENRVTAEWYAYSYRGGRRASAKIGSYPVLGLAAARKEFRERHAPAISAGAAPVGLRARVDATQREATIGALFDDYVAYLETGGKSVKAARGHLNRAAAHIGAKKIASTVTAADISGFLGAVHARGSIVSARDARAYLHAAFQRALKSENDYTQRGKVKSWGLAFNPITAIPVDASAFRAGNRHLSPEEWAAFYRWLETKDEGRVVAPALRIVMLTGQRLREILCLTTRHYDAANQMLDWEKTKNGRPHSIPLPRQAVPIIESLHANGHGLFFPHRQATELPTGHAAVEKLVKIYRRANPAMESFNGQDLRRTWKTLTGAAGLSKEIRDRLQNHSNASGDISARHYDRYSYKNEKTAAMATWSDFVDAMLAAKPATPAASPA